MADAFLQSAALWPVAVPLAGAALAALSWTRPSFQRAVATATLAAMALSSLALFVAVARRGIVVTGFGGWPAPFGIVFVADRLSAVLVLVTAAVAAATAVFGRADIRRRQERAGFHPLFLGMLAGVNGAFLTGDVFNLYVWFEMMLVTAIGLLLLDRRPSRIDGALRYALLNILGTIFFLTAVALLYGAAGTLTMADLARIVPALEPSPALAASAFLFLAGFGIKAGVFPLFFWLPASYHTAPITVAAAFAGLLTKVGVYAAIRIFTLVFPLEIAGMRAAMAVIAAATMVTGVLGAAAQWDIRRVLAFHIISQIGYMLMGLAIGTPAALAGAVFYVVHHIIVKTNLFLIAGAVDRACGSYDLKKAGGLMKAEPWLAFLFAVPALSLAGMPPFSGFWAKFLVIDAAFRGGEVWLGIVALLVGLLTLYSMSKIWSEAFWKTLPGRRDRIFRPIPPVMLAPIAALASVTLLIGVLAEPLVAYSRLAARDLADPGVYMAAVLGAAGPQAAGPAGGTEQ